MIHIQKSGDILIENIEIFDIYGRLILTPETQNEISIEGLGAGVYLIKLEKNYGSVDKRLIKQ